MKKILSVLKAVTAIAVLLLTFIACDKDFTTIGTDVIGNDHFDTEVASYSTITYNKKLDPVQTNNLTSNLFGFYNDIYGKASANVVSQITLSSTESGVNIQLDSVALSIPYFSSADTDDEGDTEYILDSIYGNVGESGNSMAFMKLSMFRNNYFLSNYDPESGFEDSQKYYSDGTASGGSTIPVAELESELIYENDEFKFNSNQITLAEENDDGDMEATETLDPGLLLVFKEGEGVGEGILYSPNLQFWQETILDKMKDEELSNSNNFNNYFRGIYFKLEEVSEEGAMAMLNFGSANITLYYRSIPGTDTDDDGIPDTYDADADGDGQIDDDKTDTDNDGITDEADINQTGGVDEDGDGFDDEVVLYTNKTIVLNFSGNRINIFDNNFTMNLVDGNSTLGDEKLYLKGGEGAMAVVKIFDGENIDSDDSFDNAFEEFKKDFVEVDEDGDFVSSKRLVNEANLVFYEDENQVFINDHEFDRLYMYDLKNNQPIIDYFYDASSTAAPYFSISNHLGLREGEVGDKKFKIRITEHINNILLRDSTNTKLGLVISNNVNSTQNAQILGATSDDDVSTVPTGAVLSPKGTVLYGNNTTNTEKKVELEIFYTEPNN